MHVKSDLLHVVERNRAKFDAAEAYESILTGKRYGSIVMIPDLLACSGTFFVYIFYFDWLHVVGINVCGVV